MPYLSGFFYVLMLGIALASVWYWIAVLFGILRNVNMMEKYKWWLAIIVPQAVVIILALKALRLLPLING